jgi:hypothetical protein
LVWNKRRAHKEEKLDTLDRVMLKKRDLEVVKSVERQAIKARNSAELILKEGM